MATLCAPLTIDFRRDFVIWPKCLLNQAIYHRKHAGKLSSVASPLRLSAKRRSTALHFGLFFRDVIPSNNRERPISVMTNMACPQPSPPRLYCFGSSWRYDDFLKGRGVEFALPVVPSRSSPRVPVVVLPGSSHHAYAVNVKGSPSCL
jgi:hypothetical protein